MRRKTGQWSPIRALLLISCQQEDMTSALGKPTVIQMRNMLSISEENGGKKGKKALLGERKVHRSPNSEDLTEVCLMNFLLFLWYEFLA